MSRISQDFINSIGCLYEEMSIKENDFLNEESQHYDQEASELVEDILATISTSMIYEGYSAEGIIGFLADSSEQDIIEKYLSFDENILIESTVPEDYIEEQSIIINERIGSALKLLGRAVKPTLRTLKVAGKRAIGPAARKKIGQAVTKVKEIGSKAKAALTSPTAKKIGLGALGAGALVGLPYVGAKLAGAGSQSSESPKPTSSNIDGGEVRDLTAYRAGGGAAKSRRTGMTTREIEELGRKNIANKPPTPSKPPSSASEAPSRPSSRRSSTPPSKTSSTPSKQPAIGTTPGGTKFERRTPTSAELRAAQQARAAGKSEEDVIRAGVERGTKLMGGPEGPGKIDDKSIAKDIEDFKKRITKKESYDAYDLVLDYLFETGHVETIDEAHYVMLEMDVQMISNIISHY